MKALKNVLHDRRCLLFIDLEGTQSSHEIIEIGAYKVLLKEDLTVKKVFKPYHAYVLAKHRVGPVVSQLTGITDLKLKREGIPFRTVQLQLKKYLGKDYERCLFVSYGEQDANFFINSAENNMDASVEEARKVARRFFDFQGFFRRYVADEHNNPYSLTRALALYDIPFEGTAHNAQADAYNLLLLFQAFLEKKEITLNHYAKMLTHAPHLPSSISRATKALAEGKDVTSAEFFCWVKDELQ